MAKIRRMFPGGNTAEGFYSFHDNIIDSNRNMLYVLKGMPGGGKSSLMKYIGERMTKEGYDIEYHHCPSDPESIDGIVIVPLNIAIVDGTFPHVIDPTYPGLIDKLVDLGKFIDEEVLIEYKDEIMKAKANNKSAYRKAFTYFRAAKTVYEEIVEHNKAAVDFKHLNKLTKRLMDDIFSKETDKDITSFYKRHLFSSANTPDGFVDYTPTILEHISNIYYIEGEIGTGKSTLMNRIIEEATIRDYYMEIYHNSTIPDKIESIFIPDLEVFITSNRHGVEFSHKKIDLNQYFDESVKDEEDYRIYNLLIENAIKKLSSARKNHDILEKCYRPAIDYDGVDMVTEEILEEILAH